jgi:hypothetical protein
VELGIFKIILNGETFLRRPVVFGATEPTDEYAKLESAKLKKTVVISACDVLFAIIPALRYP